MHAETLLDIAMKHANTLITGAQRGDEKALNNLVSLWYKRIYNYAFKYMSEHDLASEIAQKTFIAMFKGIHKLKEVDRFKPWLYRIATNLCYEEERRNRQVKTVSLTVSRNEEMEEAKGSRYNPERSFQQLELEIVLLEALSEISDEHRSIVIMKEYEGLKFREIAEVLDVSENTVKTRLYAGLNNLKDILKKKNITRETVYYEL